MQAKSANRDAAGKSIRIASIGECMIELVETGERSMRRGFGGDTLNTAVYMARCGAGHGISVDYVTALGDDPYSDEMIAGWRAEGVGTGLVVRLAGRLPGLHTIRTAAGGERSFFYWRSAAAARDLFRCADTGRIAAALTGFDVLYLSGISLSILDDASRERLLAVLAAARAAGARIAVDTNYRPRNWPGADEARLWKIALFRHADIALPTFEEQAVLFGDPDPAASADRLHGLGVGEVVVKHGPEPCLVSTPAGRVEVPPSNVPDPIDTTAAGDSFNAAYLVARMLGCAAPAAAEAGHRLAAAVIRHRGAIIPRDAMPKPD